MWQAHDLTLRIISSQVFSLFQNQEDLLAEFSQFFPEATAYSASLSLLPPVTKKQPPGANAGKGSKGTRKVGLGEGKGQ